MSDTVASPLARQFASPSRAAGPTRFFPGLERANDKRLKPHPAPALSVSRKTPPPEPSAWIAVPTSSKAPLTNPFVDHISDGWHFDNPDFLDDLTVTFIGGD